MNINSRLKIQSSRHLNDILRITPYAGCCSGTRSATTTATTTTLPEKRPIGMRYEHDYFRVIASQKNVHHIFPQDTFENYEMPYWILSLLKALIAQAFAAAQ